MVTRKILEHHLGEDMSNTTPNIVLRKLAKKHFNIAIRKNRGREFNNYAAKHFENQQNLVGVEIGVAAGKNAEDIIEKLDVEKLYLVDPYQRVENGFSEKVENCAEKRLSKYSGKIKWLKKTSDDAAGHIPHQLDFVYIDGLHTYRQVSRDLQNYYPKVKESGLVAGHDAHMKGVWKAVTEFSDQINQNPRVLSNAEGWPDWVFNK